MSDPGDRARAGVQVLFDHGSKAVRRARERLLTGLKAATEPATALAKTDEAQALGEPAPEPPVVARLMVEIRSDGSRTIARGALKDLLSEQEVALRAEGKTPAELVRSLAGNLLSLPLFAAQIARSLKGDVKRKPGDG